MVETKAQQKARLKKLRKKFGLGEFKKNKKTSKKRKRRSVKGSRLTKFTRRRKIAKRKRKSARRAAPFSRVLALIASAAAYGAFRAKISQTIAPLTANIPLGNISDEAGMIAVAMVAKKFGGARVPFLKKIADAGIAIESARIGEELLSGGLNLGGGSGNGVGSPTIG